MINRGQGPGDSVIYGEGGINTFGCLLVLREILLLNQSSILVHLLLTLISQLQQVAFGKLDHVATVEEEDEKMICGVVSRFDEVLT